MNARMLPSVWDHATADNDPRAHDDANLAELKQWLDAFAAAVREVDYAAGARLFAPEVVSFGTVGVLLAGRDNLIDRQWKRVWGVTNGFRFDMRHLTWGVEGDTAWLAVLWSSRSSRTGDGPHDRTGRASYVLRRRDGRWLALHSHHSLDPCGHVQGSETV